MENDTSWEYITFGANFIFFVVDQLWRKIARSATIVVDVIFLNAENSQAIVNNSGIKRVDIYNNVLKFKIPVDNVELLQSCKIFNDVPDNSANLLNLEFSFLD